MVAPVTLHDQAYFLAFFDRNLDSGWLLPLKANPASGYEILQGMAKVGERTSLAVSRLEGGSIIIYSEGGQFATGAVEFLRPTNAAGAVTIKAGTIVSTSNGGREFITTQDAVFGAGDLGPKSATVIAVAPSWQWNVTGQRITARGETLPGEIDTITHFIQVSPAAPATPTFIDATITVRQITDVTGGADPMLDGLGEDRGILRKPGESDPAYRQRIRTLPDTVSPGAIMRAIALFFTPYGLPTQFEELWDIRYQTCYDAPSPNASTPSYCPFVDPASPQFDANYNPAYDSNLFTYDDPRPPYGAGPGHPVPPGLPFYNRWLDEMEARGAFVVCVPNFPTLNDVGMAYDDTAMTTAAHRVVVGTVTGHRGYAAYDVPSGADPTLVYQGGYDGFDLQKQSLYRALWQLLQDIKAGGVAALLELQGM